MTPQNEQLTRDGVRSMISDYDLKVVIPRERIVIEEQKDQHEANQKRFSEIERILDKWSWPLYVLCTGVTALVIHAVIEMVRGR